MTDRLDAGCEEILLTLLPPDQPAARTARRGLVVTGRRKGASVALEFVAAAGSENVQVGDHIDEVSADREVSLRLLRHLSSSVRHQQYHDTDIVTVEVEARRSGARDLDRDGRGGKTT